MPSPFPGMNPYFEQADVWPDFHNEFLTCLRHELAPLIRPKYIIQLEKHVYIHDLPPEPRRFLGRPDVSVIRSRSPGVGLADLGVLEVTAAIEIPMPDQDIERVSFLELRDRQNRDLVAVIELLSPSNKRPGEDRQQYLTKRREILRSDAHLVEIDLLRGWPPMPPEDRPAGDYSVLISRAGRRHVAEFRPIRLRDRLPVIPIPLRDPDPDGRVDLQAVLHRAYDGPAYEDFIYEGSPEPPLSAEDAEWASGLVPRRGEG